MHFFLGALRVKYTQPQKLSAKFTGAKQYDLNTILIYLLYIYIISIKVYEALHLEIQNDMM